MIFQFFRVVASHLLQEKRKERQQRKLHVRRQQIEIEQEQRRGWQRMAVAADGKEVVFDETVYSRENTCDWSRGLLEDAQVSLAPAAVHNYLH